MCERGLLFADSAVIQDSSVRPLKEPRKNTFEMCVRAPRNKRPRLSFRLLKRPSGPCASIDSVFGLGFRKRRVRVVADMVRGVRSCLPLEGQSVAAELQGFVKDRTPGVPVTDS